MDPEAVPLDPIGGCVDGNMRFNCGNSCMYGNDNCTCPSGSTSICFNYDSSSSTTTPVCVANKPKNYNVPMCVDGEPICPTINPPACDVDSVDVQCLQGVFTCTSKATDQAPVCSLDPKAVELETSGACHGGSLRFNCADLIDAGGNFIIPKHPRCIWDGESTEAKPIKGVITNTIDTYGAKCDDQGAVFTCTGRADYEEPICSFNPAAVALSRMGACDLNEDTQFMKVRFLCGNCTEADGKIICWDETPLCVTSPSYDMAMGWTLWTEPWWSW